MYYYTIYKITNIVNGKIYIGAHKTDNLDDDYMGSGKHLVRSQKKYGLENFEKEILQIFDNPEDMFKMESELVNEEFVERKDTYNLKNGGDGGWDYINSSLLTGQKRLEHNRKYSPFKDTEWQSSNKENLQRGRKRGGNKTYEEKIGIFDPNMKNGFSGKKHSEEFKKKLGKINSEKQSGEKNSQYGKKKSEESKNKISEKLKNKPMIKCSFCEKESRNASTIKRWHNDNCRFKK